LVNSGLTICLVLGLSVSDLSQNAVVNLGMDELRFPNPVFVGDTLWAESIVLNARASGSRPYAGIVEVRTRGYNQHGDVISTWKRSVMVYKRDAPHDKNVFPMPKVSITEDL
jgi:acyl dehydratase